MKSGDVIGQFLRDIGATPVPIVGGGGEKSAVAISAANMERLLSDLERVRVFSAGMVRGVFVVHLLVFLIVCAALWYNRTDTRFLLAIFAGGTGIFAWLVVSLKGALRESVRTQVLLALVPSLPPTEVIRALAAASESGI